MSLKKEGNDSEKKEAKKINPLREEALKTIAEIAFRVAEREAREKEDARKNNEIKDEDPR